MKRTRAGLSRRRFLGHSLSVAALGPSASGRAHGASTAPLPGTNLLTRSGDIADQMVAGIHRDLDARLADAVEAPQGSAVAVESRRQRLRKIIGAIDDRLPPAMEIVMVDGQEPYPAGRGPGYSIFAVRWPVFPGVWGEGLLLRPLLPAGARPRAQVVALPDADWSPEALVGLVPGVPGEAQFARRLVENGCLVLVPVLIDRSDTWSGNPRLGLMTNQPHREFIYRMAFEVGRHIIGYEVQKVLAAVDWFRKTGPGVPVGVAGYGEGGQLALFSAALDARIDAVMVSGAFGYSVARQETGRRQSLLWQEPIYRNVWGRLPDFGDGALAAMVAPRGLVVEVTAPPAIAGPPPVRSGHRWAAAPGRSPGEWGEEVDRELGRARASYAAATAGERVHKIEGRDSPPGGAAALGAFLAEMGARGRLKPARRAPVDARTGFDPSARLHRQLDELVSFTQEVLRHCEAERQKFFWSRASTDSPSAWQASCEPLRRAFRDEVVGSLPVPGGAGPALSRQSIDAPRWRGYEVLLDVTADVFAYGYLLVPRDLKPGERRPVVVCQHGLEGRPEAVVEPKASTPSYHSFGAALADRGFIVFAPQNPYIGNDKFRSIQRKANLLGLSLFSYIVRQHERVLDWLATLPFVDERRIGFYGLSYGGKTAMRVPALVERYCLSIASGDFNEWIGKNASLDRSHSYMFSREYEIFEFDLGNTFNYAEMAGLIAPRPFMVERGHDDGVATDEWVAYEYAKVGRLYDRLGLGERTTIEYFNGPHEIHGVGTFAFLHRHLRFPGG